MNNRKRVAKIKVVGRSGLSGPADSFIDFLIITEVLQKSCNNMEQVVT